MTVSDLPLVAMLKTRMHWHQSRQKVLAENVSNADTPGFKPRDLAEPTFGPAGEVRGGTVLLERSVVAAAQGLPLTLLGVMVNDQAFTKTANCWGVSNNRRGTNTNRIVVFRRD